MYKVICDRCKKPIDGTTYYTVDIYGHDISPTNDGRRSIASAIQNVITNEAKGEGLEKHYCSSCRDKIEKFLRAEDVKQRHCHPKEPPLRVLNEEFKCKRKNKIKKFCLKLRSISG